MMHYSSSNISSPAIRAAMPWIFIGGEVIGFAVIACLFLFMKVENYGAYDRAAIRMDHAAAGAGGESDSAEEEAFEDTPDLRDFNAQREAAGRRPLRVR